MEKTEKKETIIEETKENIKNNENYKIKASKKSLIITGIVLAVIILLVLFSTIFALININNTKIISKVKINGVDFSNLSKEEASKKLNKELNEKLENPIKIKADDYEYELTLSQMEIKYNIDKAIEDAYNVGRSGNIISNNYETLKTIVVGKDVKIEYTLNEEILDGIVEDIAKKIPNAVKQAKYTIDEDNEQLIIKKGKAGNSIDKEALKQRIRDEIINPNFNSLIAIELIKEEPKEIDIDEIYSKVHTEPKDAYYTKDPFKVFPHVNGVDFDLKAAKKLLKKNKNKYVIDLKITQPEVTTSQIGTEAFPDLLSTFSTRYDASNVPRTTNLRLAMGKLDGTVVAPDEIFSYNNTLGERTEAGGYQYAGGFAAGGVVQTLAGGICQISSTLYDAAVYANLEIIERYNHMFQAGYVGPGKDATVVYGSLDFRFKNTRKYPIMIKTSIGGGVATVSIYGIKEDVEYDIDIETTVLSYIPCGVTYKTDNSLAPGREVVSQYGLDGCSSITYKVTRLNGSEVSREVLSQDYYDPMNKVILVGPKKSSQGDSKKKDTDKKEDKDKKDTKPTNTNTNINTNTNKTNTTNTNSNANTNTSKNTNSNTTANTNTNTNTNTTNKNTTKNQRANSN